MWTSQHIRSAPRAPLSHRCIARLRRHFARHIDARSQGLLGAALARGNNPLFSERASICENRLQERYRMATHQPVEWLPPITTQPDTMKRYERLADEIAGLIRSGVLAPGERVPSVRNASRIYGVSPSTVFQAYYLLEDRGLILARARSGYFVREHAQRPLPEPEIGPRS